MEMMGYKKSSHALFDGIQSLFHYQPLSSEQHKTWLIETLLENKIYCSHPADFNDPWDMKPLVKETYNEGDINKFIEYLRNKHASSFEKMKCTGEFIYDNAFLDELARSFVLWHWEMFEKKFRVYCLTLSSDNLLMWSHYANNHRGICLEFDTNNSVFGSAWNVEYHEEYPYSPWDNNFDVMRLALTKAKCWMYEREYRVLSETDGLGKPLTVGNDNKLLFHLMP